MGQDFCLIDICVDNLCKFILVRGIFVVVVFVPNLLIGTTKAKGGGQ